MNASGLSAEPRVRVCLPSGIAACLFDLDGVLTNTARLHEAAWKETFDPFLRTRAADLGLRFVPFTEADYEAYVDGRPRLDGVRTFLGSRGIVLPAAAVGVLANQKNDLVLELMQREGVESYAGSIRFARAALDDGLRLAVVSASSNCAGVLCAAGIADLFEIRVDGTYARERGLNGKPAPDTFLAAADALGARPQDAAVFEDALAGVAAGRAGGFGLVVGVDRRGQADELRKAGADVIVRDLDELLETR